MKLRIHDGTFRFRITGPELDKLQESGLLRSENKIPDSSGRSKNFIFEIRRESGRKTTQLQLESYGMTLNLSDRDFSRLLEPDREGVYIEEDWTDEQDVPSYFLVFVEKDRRAQG